MSRLIALGYHGTSREAAEVILEAGRSTKSRFLISENVTDWLGDGVYFFQDAPYRARDWPLMRLPRSTRSANPVVLCAELDLTKCLDLIDVRAGNEVAEWYPEMKRVYRAMKARLPKNLGGRRFFDRVLVNYALEQMQLVGKTVPCVRAAFQEGKPLVPKSRIYSHSHVQIVVRPMHTEIIRDVWVHNFEGEN